MFANALAPSTTARFGAPGTYVLRLTAHDTALVASDDVTVSVSSLPPVGAPPSVAITAPSDLSNATAPIEVRGTVASETLLGWELEYRDRSQSDEWRTVAAGDTPVTDAVLGLRLVATETSRRTAETPEDQPSLNVRGNFKVGARAMCCLS
jgi:hypothetical protein